MSQPTENPSTKPHSRWQFSLRGMFVLTLSVAVGASVVRCNMHSWLGVGGSSEDVMKVGLDGGLFAFLLFWMVLGFIFQIRDLRTTHASNHTLIVEQRWGLGFEIFWRLTVTALLAIYVFISFLIDRGTLTLSEWAGLGWLHAGIFRVSVLILLLVILVGSIPHIRREKPTSIINCGLQLIVSMLAIVFCLERWMDLTFIPYLVHLATIGINQAQPLKFTAINPSTYNFSVSLFFWWSLLSVLIVAINWTLLTLLARQWSTGYKHRLIWSGLLIAGIALAGSFVIWIETTGYNKISPFLAEAGRDAPIHCWIATAILILILTTLLTYRMTADYDSLAIAPQVSWRRNPNKYYHEKRWMLVLLAVAIVWFHYEIFFYQENATSKSMLALGFNYSRAISLRELIESWFSVPTDYLWLSLILLALHRAFKRRKDSKYLQADLPRVNPARFVTIWIATAVVMVSGALVLVWMSFALWFNPWFRGRWP
jgi:hypothetical protein